MDNQSTDQMAIDALDVATSKAPDTFLSIGGQSVFKIEGSDANHVVLKVPVATLRSHARGGETLSCTAKRLLTLES